MKVQKNRKKIFGLFFKIIISVALIYLIILRIDLNEIYFIIKDVKLHIYIMAFFLIVLSVILSSLKWKILLRSLGEKTNLWKLVQYYYFGTFFNMFFPSSIGGDVIRVAILGKNNNKLFKSGVSVLFERIIGFFALLTIASVAFIINFHFVKEPPLIYFMTGVLILETSFILAFIEPRVLNIFRKIGIKLFSLFRIKKGRKWVDDLYEAFIQVRENKRAFGWSLFISFIFQLTAIFTFVVAMVALNLDIPVRHFFSFQPIIMILTMLPVSFNGIGVREWGYIFLYGEVGVAREIILAISFSVFFLKIINSLLGGIMYLIYLITNKIKESIKNGNQGIKS